MIINIIIYVLFLCIFFFIALPTERKDLMCPQGPLTKNCKRCKEGNGKTYYGSKPKKSDTPKEILKRIEIAAVAGGKDVTWRKSFIFSLIASFLISFVVCNKLPDGKQLFLTTLIIFGAFYGYFSLYQYHHYNHIRDNILENVRKLKRSN